MKNAEDRAVKTTFHSVQSGSGAPAGTGTRAWDNNGWFWGGLG